MAADFLEKTCGWTEIPVQSSARPSSARGHAIKRVGPLTKAPVMSLLESEAIIFSQPHGGLGDNLLYSTLPERFTALGKPF